MVISPFPLQVTAARAMPGAGPAGAVVLRAERRRLGPCRRFGFRCCFRRWHGCRSSGFGCRRLPSLAADLGVADRLDLGQPLLLLIDPHGDELDHGLGYAEAA